MKPPDLTGRIFALGVMLIFYSPLRAQDAITIDRHDPTADRIFFDPRNLPQDMPKLKAGEAALCQYNFDCSVKLSYEISEQSRGGEEVRVTARLKQMKVTLKLHNRIYLPTSAPAKIRAHEEGHRIINERAYEAAQASARAAAMEVLTRTWTGTGADADAAGKDATDQAVKQLCDTYLAQTAGVASRMGDIYDELTRHGRNIRLKESDAIEQALAKYSEEQQAGKQ